MKAHKVAYPTGRPAPVAVPVPVPAVVAKPPKRVSDAEIDRIVAKHMRGASPEVVAKKQKSLRDMVAEAAETGEIFDAAGVREVLRLVDMM